MEKHVEVLTVLADSLMKKASHIYIHTKHEEDVIDGEYLTVQFIHLICHDEEWTIRKVNGTVTEIKYLTEEKLAVVTAKFKKWVETEYFHDPYRCLENGEIKAFFITKTGN